MLAPYSPTILEHFRHPHNYGALPAPEITSEGVSALCGDRMRLELNVSAEQIITAVRFRGDGCIISYAAASLLTELIQGRTLQEVALLPPATLLSALNGPLRPARTPCALLPLQVLQDGIAAYLTSRRGRP